jgi:23S rRNA (uracil1939-C5)-methyltransferase
MVARQEGRVVFVQGGVPGETVRAELLVEKKSFAEARAVTVLTPSERRVAPPCIYFGENGAQRGAVPTGNDVPGERGACGGCQYQHLSYDAQLDLKTRIVADLMHRQARLPDVEVRPTVPSPAPWRYRNRARWIVNEEGVPCYHQAASDRLLPVRLCHIVQPLIEEVLGHLGDAAWRLPLRTLVAEITARTAVPWTEGDAEQTTPSLLLALHPRPGATRRDLRLLAGDLGLAIPALDGVVMAPRAEAPRAAASVLWGAGYFDARFAGYRFRLAPLTFFQVNEPAAELLVDEVLDALATSWGRACSTSTPAPARSRCRSPPTRRRCWRWRTTRWPSTMPSTACGPTAWTTSTSSPVMPQTSWVACPAMRPLPRCWTRLAQG